MKKAGMSPVETHVEATPVVNQEPRKRDPIKTKRAGERVVPPYIFVPGEGRENVYVQFDTAKEEGRAHESRKNTERRVKYP
jgi:hypothetical protein